MRKAIYIILTLIIIGIIGYTVYYAMTKATVPATPVVATSTPAVAETTSPKNTLTTKSGKTITVRETNPSGQSLSTITLIPKGFENDQQIILEKNKLTAFFLTDMNDDGFDELILVTTAQGSGSYGEVDIYTTINNKGLIKVTVPSVTEDTTKKGGLFEGYMGHDIFSAVNGVLARQFPLNNASSTNISPSGQSKTIFYSLVETNGTYSVTLSDSNTPSTKTAATTTLTIKQIPPTTLGTTIVSASTTKNKR